jgi:RNA polymerase sigma-70 factor, ECF subfamily
MQLRDQEQAACNDNDPFTDTRDDWELVAYCQKEKNLFFPKLVKRHYALVVNIGFRFFSDQETAKDMAQEVFLKVYHHLEEFRPGKQPFVHWLCRITTNHCRSHYRKQSSEKRAVVGGKVDFWYQDDGADPLEHFDDQTKSNIDYVNQALQRIKPNERIVLILSHMAELKTCDIAPIVKKPEYTVRRMLRRAEEKMRKLITQRITEQNAQA